MLDLILRKWSYTAGHSARCAGAALACTIGSVVGSGALAADSPQTFLDSVREDLTAYGIAERTTDSNLYRLPDNPAAFNVVLPPGRTYSDAFTSTGAGVDGEFYPWRQDVFVHARIEDVRYDNNTYLNYVAQSVGLAWSWISGPTVTGQFTGNYDRALAGYVNNRVLARDVVDKATGGGNVKWAMGAYLSLQLALRSDNTEHTDTVQQYQDNRKNSGTFSIVYSRSDTDKLALNFHEAHARFDDTFLTYTDKSVYASYSYLFSTITQVDLDGGWNRRSYQESLVGAFSGGVGHASFVWQPTPITSVTLKGFRELNAYLSTETDYYVSNGGSLNVAWNPTTTLSFGLGGSFERQRYQGIGLGLLADQRVDHVNNESVSVKWTPAPWFELSLAGGIEHRASTVAYFNYSDRIGNIALRLLW